MLKVQGLEAKDLRGILWGFEGLGFLWVFWGSGFRIRHIILER